MDLKGKAWVRCLAALAASAVVVESIPAVARGAASPATPAAAFERLKRLAGRWEGRSTKGWTDTGQVKVIAGGSVVELASFDAHPGEEMRTLFYLDGDRLMLTHFCVARRH